MYISCYTLRSLRSVSRSRRFVPKLIAASLRITTNAGFRPTFELARYLSSDRPAVDKNGQRNYSHLSEHQCGHSSLHGRKKENEDYYNCIEVTPDVSYFAVFDGHCGDFASNFVNKELPSILEAQITSFGLLTNAHYETHGEVMMRSAFEKCQTLLKDTLHSQEFSKKTRGMEPH